MASVVSICINTEMLQQKILNILVGDLDNDEFRHAYTALELAALAFETDDPTVIQLRETQQAVDYLVGICFVVRDEVISDRDPKKWFRKARLPIYYHDAFPRRLIELRPGYRWRSPEEKCDSSLEIRKAYCEWVLGQD